MYEVAKFVKPKPEDWDNGCPRSLTADLEAFRYERSHCPMAEIIREHLASLPGPEVALRYDPTTNRHNGRRLVRGDLLRDGQGVLYALDRDRGYMLNLDRLSAEGRPVEEVSFSVDPTDTDRYRDLYLAGGNVYDQARPGPEVLAPPDGGRT